MPEFELFDLGQVHALHRLLDKYGLPYGGKVHCDFVMGVPGGMPGTADALVAGVADAPGRGDLVVGHRHRPHHPAGRARRAVQGRPPAGRHGGRADDQPRRPGGEQRPARRARGRAGRAGPAHPDEHRRGPHACWGWRPLPCDTDRTERAAAHGSGRASRRRSLSQHACEEHVARARARSRTEPGPRGRSSPRCRGYAFRTATPTGEPTSRPVRRTSVGQYDVRATSRASVWRTVHATRVHARLSGSRSRSGDPARTSRRGRGHVLQGRPWHNRRRLLWSSADCFSAPPSLQFATRRARARSGRAASVPTPAPSTLRRGHRSPPWPRSRSAGVRPVRSRSRAWTAPASRARVGDDADASGSRSLDTSRVAAFALSDSVDGPLNGDVSLLVRQRVATERPACEGSAAA